mgnify:CR=1 FL=1
MFISCKPHYSEYVTAEDVVLLFGGGTLGCHSRCREESGDHPIQRSGRNLARRVQAFYRQGYTLDPVTMKKEDLVKDMLEFYMGKNTMERQNFIIDNLVVEEDVIN